MKKHKRGEFFLFAVILTFLLKKGFVIYFKLFEIKDIKGSSWTENMEHQAKSSDDVCYFLMTLRTPPP